MRLGWLSLLLILPALAGCGSSTASSNVSNGAGGNYNGGQTGSLIPNCGIAPLSGQGQSVPSGDQAFVFITRGCSSTVQLTDIHITDAGGNPVALETEALGDGAFLVKSSVTLTEGEYGVSLPAGAAGVAGAADAAGAPAAIAVSAAAPLPMQVGELSVTKATCRQSEFALALDDALLPYLPLVQFSVAVDNGAGRVLGDYGSLPAPNGQLSVPLNHCTATSCLATGSHRVRVTATIAGETTQPAPAVLTFVVDCPGQVAPVSGAAPTNSMSSGSSFACALAPAISARHRGTGWAPLAVLVWGLITLGRRRGNRMHRKKIR